MESINQKVTIKTAGDFGIGRATTIALFKVVRVVRIFQQMVIKETLPRINTAKPRLMLGLIMSSAMATVLSFVLTLSYVGFTPDFLSIWLHRLELSLIVGPPVALALLPLVMKLVGRILKS
jgi:hypothetical protein